MARPRIEGSNITLTGFKLRPELISTVIAGANSLSRKIAREHSKKRTPSPSNALWLRSLIEYTFEHISLATPEVQKAAMVATVEPVDSPIPVSLKIPDDLRIKLRKIECYLQALDWTIDFNRNAAMNFLVMVYGEKFNQSLEPLYSPP